MRTDTFVEKNCNDYVMDDVLLLGSRVLSCLLHDNDHLTVHDPTYFMQNHNKYIGMKY